MARGSSSLARRVTSALASYIGSSAPAAATGAWASSIAALAATGACPAAACTALGTSGRRLALTSIPSRLLATGTGAAGTGLRSVYTGAAGVSGAAAGSYGGVFWGFGGSSLPGLGLGCREGVAGSVGVVRAGGLQALAARLGGRRGLSGSGAWPGRTGTGVGPATASGRSVRLSGCSGGGGGGGSGGGGVLRAPTLVRTAWQDSKGYTHFEGRGWGWHLSSAEGRRRALYGAGCLGAAFGAYYVYCMEEVPYTGRRHSIMLVSSSNEQAMGSQLFEELKALAAADGTLLPHHHPDAQRVERIGRRIAAVAGDGGGGGSQGHMRGLRWEFAVIHNPQPNAFVVPGGKVVVHTGLLRLLGGSDDELAAVLAHEVGHILARHVAERMSTLNVWALLNMVLRLTLGFGVPNVAVMLGVFLPYSRLAEHEADALGVRLMSRACFDPSGAPVMLAKLNGAEQEAAKRGSLVGSVPAFLRTHPLTEDRVERVKQELPKAFQLYTESGCATRRTAWGRSFDAWHENGGGEGSGGGGGWAEVEVRFG